MGITETVSFVSEHHGTRRDTELSGASSAGAPLHRLQAAKLILFERIEKYKKTENFLSFEILDS